MTVNFTRTALKRWQHVSLGRSLAMRGERLGKKAETALSTVAKQYDHGTSKHASDPAEGDRNADPSQRPTPNSQLKDRVLQK